MTPMIDVVFLLIIFFLCIDFRVLEAKVPAYLPKDKGSSDHQEREVAQVRVRIVCDSRGAETLRPGSTAYHLVGHRVHYTVGPRKVEDLDGLRAELQRIYDDPALEIPDARQPGASRRQDVVVEPLPGVVYGDVAPCVDAIAAVGFEQIHFGGGVGRRKPR